MHAVGTNVDQGSDTYQLAEGSSLLKNDLSVGMLEALCPVFAFFWFNVLNVLSLRVGSSILGNRAINGVAAGRRVLARRDVQAALAAKDVLPGQDSRFVESMDIRKISRIYLEEIRQSFDYILSYKPDAMVIEGGSLLLPQWSGQPHPDFMLLVGPGWLELHKGLNPEIAQLQLGDTNSDVDDLAKWGSNLSQKYAKDLLPAVPSHIRHTALDHVVGSLLNQCGVT
jgi:hypothetical protein